MSTSPPRTGSGRTERKQIRRAKPERKGLSNGVLLAGAAGVLFASVLGWAVLRNPSPSGATAADPASPDDIPDITELQVAEGMSLEFTDRDDPNRLAGLVTAERVEPVGPNERLVEQPRAFLFLDDGRTLHVRADSGRFFIANPDDPPESGVLRGGVVISVFDPLEGGRRPDPETDEAFGTATFDEPLRFDFTHARASSTGRFVVETPSIEFVGTHLTAVINEVRGRLELAEVRRGEYIRFKSAGASNDTGPETQRQPAQQTAQADRRARPADRDATPTPAGDAEPLAPIETLYRAAFLEDVQVAQGPRTLASDTLDLWVRLLDNQLPQGAIREIAAAPAAESGGESSAEADSEPSERPQGARSANATSPMPPADGPADVASATALASDPAPEAGPADDAGDIMLTWTGRMRIVPIETEIDGTPDELANDHVALRFTAATTGLVSFDDAERGATARAVSMHYGATTAQMTLAGPGGAVEVAQPGAGTLSASTVVGSLAGGAIEVRGPGVLLGDDAPAANADPRTRVRWTESAAFAFHTDEQRRPTPTLASADFTGDVDATDGTASIDADTLAIGFADAAGNTPILERVAVTRGIVRDGRGGTFSADELSVAFDEGTLGEDFDPARLVARGSVLASDDRRTLTADELDASLTRQLNGRIEITGADAVGAVTYNDETDGIRAAAETLSADAIGELVRLEGAPASIAQGRATIRGPVVLLDGRRRTADVNGAGTFTQHDERGVPVVSAAWTEDMRFDDIAGRIDCRGEASAESASGPRSTETLKAERILIEISPFDAPGERELLRATASGVRTPEGEMQLASIESRTVSADDPAFVERLVYLEGRRILADNTEQTLTVPGSGTLLSLDRTGKSDDADEPAAVDTLASPGPGLTRFRWRDRMVVRRETGDADLFGDVEVRHKALGAEDISVLQSDRLLARFAETGPNGQPASSETTALRAELISADATGAVRFINAGREVLADRLFYDAINGVADASANVGRFVELLDSSSGVPVSAEGLRWDLTRDRIEIRRPAPTSVGRP